MAGGKWTLGPLFRMRNATGCLRGLLKGPPKLFRTPKSQRTVGPHRIVVETPGFDPALGLSEIDKPLFIQAGIPEFAIETLHHGILTWLPGLDEPELDVRVLCPQKQRLAGELRPVVQHNRLGPPPLVDELLEQPADADPGNRKIDELAEAFPAILVHDVQNAQASPRGQLIRHEIHRPALVHAVQGREGHAVTGREAFTPLAPNLQLLFTIESIRLLRVHHQPLPLQQFMQQLVAIAGKRGGQFAQPGTEGGGIGPTSLMTRDRSMHPHQVTGPPLAHQPQRDQMGHRLAPGSGPYQFFDRSSFSAA